MFDLFFRYLCLLTLITSIHPAFAQDAAPSSQTEYLAKDVSSPSASIEDLNWMSGYWQGEIWGGQFEEIWSLPMAGSMMASFKFTERNQVKFYELMTISEYKGSLRLQLKHFGKDLKGWEEKDQSMDFKLVRLADSAAYFEGYTYKLINQNEMHVYVEIDNNGEKQETKFVFKRHQQ
ncbi:DUF6265 family protein [uncultured Paraglaciecola sp.]|uniref:DUF6265 family protein n=1 Tax=uncultured Paraglaciecola sp. TaxID=1765024 RepID=UPI0030DA71EF|tara:strand:- start:90355 stop:90885 length:531 start_codon:yes stop_codon:yes gene_type:complete